MFVMISTRANNMELFKIFGIKSTFSLCIFFTMPLTEDTFNIFTVKMASYKIYYETMLHAFTSRLFLYCHRTLQAKHHILQLFSRNSVQSNILYTVSVLIRLSILTQSMEQKIGFTLQKFEESLYLV